HQEAFDILTTNRDVLDDLVRALFERETLDRQEVAEVFKPLRLWPKRPPWTGSDSRVPSALPPVTPPPPAVNGRGHTNGQLPPGDGQLPPGGEEGVPAGGVPLPPGHTGIPPQLPGDSAGGTHPPAGPGITDIPPQRGPDFR
ncbi:hypothetical protein ACTVF1_22480, partial [Escherichia coli]